MKILVVMIIALVSIFTFPPLAVALFSFGIWYFGKRHIDSGETEADEQDHPNLDKKRLSIIFLIVSLFALLIFTAVNTDSNTQTPSDREVEISEEKNTDSNTQTPSDHEVEVPEEENMESPNLETSSKIEADMSFEVEGTNAIVTVDTNIPDGGVLGIVLINNETTDSFSDYTVVNNGKAVVKFDVGEWNVGYLSASWLFYFDNSQPSDVLNLYGSNGENAKGEFIIGDGSTRFATGYLEKIPYPNEEAVKENQAKLISAELDEIINSSEGIILDIKQYPDEDKWTGLAVFVSDAWYLSMEYEKERFAEQTASTIENRIKNTGQLDSREKVSIYYFDSNGKKLASPKILGGYKIER